VYIVAICNPNPPRRSQRRIKGYDLPWLGEVLKGGLGGVGVGFLDLLGFLVWGFQGDLAGFCLWFRYLTYAS
jgi:hypothetical protein